MAFLLRNCLKFSLQKQFLNACRQQNQQWQQQELKTSNFILNPHKQNPNTTQQNDTTANAQKKHKESIKITLMQNQNMTVTALEEAQSLAKRRSMHLVKVQDMDAKTQRPVYKLLTAAEMLQSELSDKSSSAGDKSVGKKSEKSLNIGSRIAEHDLASRLKNISKWLNKQHEVRILIQGNSQQDMAHCEKIFKTIEESVKTPQVIGKIVQKRTKGNIVKFNILPVTPDTNVKADAKSQ